MVILLIQRGMCFDDERELLRIGSMIEEEADEKMSTIEEEEEREKWERLEDAATKLIKVLKKKRGEKSTMSGMEKEKEEERLKREEAEKREKEAKEGKEKEQRRLEEEIKKLKKQIPLSINSLDSVPLHLSNTSTLIREGNSIKSMTDNDRNETAIIEKEYTRVCYILLCFVVSFDVC